MERDGLSPMRRSPGEGSPYQRGNRWAADLTHEGRRRTVYGTTKAETIKALDALKKRRDEGRWHVEANQTVAGVLESWYAQKQQAGRTYKTLRTYEPHVRHIRKYLGRRKLDTLQTADVRTALNQMEADGLGAATVDYCRRIINMAFNQAVRERVMTWNPAAAIQREPYKAPEKVILTREELLALFSQTEGSREHALWVVMGTGGLRFGEALGLQWDDIDWEAGQLRIERQLEYRPPKEFFLVEPKRQSFRTIAISSRTLAALGAHRTMQMAEREKAMGQGIKWGTRNLVFCGTDGAPQMIQPVSRQFKRDMAKQSIVGVTPHALRHTAITLLLSDGRPLADVSKWAGHKDPAITLKVYAHAVREHQEQMGQWMDAILERRA